MASLAYFIARRSVQSLHASNFTKSTNLHSLWRNSSIQWLCLSTNSKPIDFTSSNAYELLEVSEASSFADIKASFRKLAKETHPDLANSNDSGASQRFVQILAAYEILSDAEKRAHYDMYLLSQKKLMQKTSKDGSVSYTYRSYTTTYRQMEVVEWLKWYRCAVNDILMEKKVVTGTGHFDIIERDFYSAIHAAYYGPEIDSMDLLPDRFEAEERSVYDNPEVLHLVSGRDLFGMVSLVNKVSELPYTSHEKLTSSEPVDPEASQHLENANTYMRSGASETDCVSHTSDAYKDLELYVSGKLVATSTRIPPKSTYSATVNDVTDDQIHIFLNSSDDSISHGQGRSSPICGTVGSRNLLGSVTGLGTSLEEDSCSVFDCNGIKTHVIMKHRTFLVKHMHWYQLGGEISVCECRSTRARLPPSKFWLFEPRCGMHDIGGWYIETYGRDEKNQTVPSRRYWDALEEADKQFDKSRRLHPAFYLIGMAYRTLDLEAAKRQKKRTTFKHLLEAQVLIFLNWCKRRFISKKERMHISVICSEEVESRM